jgi:MoxR-like ATPase
MKHDGITATARHVEPVDVKDTFPVPGAPLDRFLLRLRKGHPRADEETRVLARFRAADPRGEVRAADASGRLAAARAAGSGRRTAEKGLSAARLGGEPPGLQRPLERLEVQLVLVGVGVGEVGDGFV